MLKVGETFVDGGYTYEVTGVHELGYLLSKRVEKKVSEVKVDVPKNPTITSKPIEPQYNKTQINRMSTSDLEKLAKELEVEIGTGAEMKKAIIEKLGL